MRQIMFDFLGSLLIFLIVFGIAIVDSSAAYPAESITSGQSPRTALYLQAAADQPLQRAKDGDLDVDIKVNGGLAEAVVIQRFFNPANAAMLGAFSYQMPQDAVLRSLKIRNGDRRLEARLQSRERADALKAATHSLAGPIMSGPPSHQEGIWVPLAMVEPASYVSVELRYSWLIEAEDGRFNLTVPLAGRSYGRRTPNPAAQSGELARQIGRPASNSPRVSLSVELDAGFPIAQIDSPSHDIAVERRTDGTARIQLRSANAPDRPAFQVGWTLQAGMLPSTALYRETVAGEDYILALLTPPSPEARISIRPREVVFLIDASAAMAGDRLERVKAGLLSALAGLEEGDRLNLIAFNDTVQQLFAKPVGLGRDSRIAAEDFINSMTAEGTAKALPALRRALIDQDPGNSSTVRQVVMVTAGLSDEEPELLSAIANDRGRSRLLLVGFAGQGDAEFMRRAAEVGRGSYTQLLKGEAVSSRISDLMNKLALPVVTDLKAQWAAGLRVESYPSPLPDLNAGEPVALIAKVSASKGNVTFSGDLGGSRWVAEFSLARAKPAVGIAALWAKRRIATLEARRFSGQDAGDILTDIREVAFNIKLASRGTDWLAVEHKPSPAERARSAHPGERRSAIPGWDFDRRLGAEPVFASRMQTLPAGSVFKSAVELPLTVVSLHAPLPGDSPLSAAAGVDAQRSPQIALLNSTRRDSPEMPPQMALEALRTAYLQLEPEANMSPGLVPQSREPARISAHEPPGDEAPIQRLLTILALALTFAGMCTLVIGLWRQLKYHYIVGYSSSRSRS